MEITQQQMKEWMDKLQDTSKVMQDAKAAMQAAETPVRNWITVQKAYQVLARLKENWDRVEDTQRWDNLDEGVEHYGDVPVEGILCRQDGIEGRVYVYDGWDWCKVTMPDGHVFKSDGCAQLDMAMHDVMWSLIEDLAWKETRKKQEAGDGQA